MRSSPLSWPNPCADDAISLGAKLGSFDENNAGFWRGMAGFFAHVVDDLTNRIAPCPWFDATAHLDESTAVPARRSRPLYTAEERARRDATVWTKVQGALAPVQFVIFLISLSLVVNYLISGHGYGIATASVIIKTFVLYTIMITGSIWEKQVFGKYLFARAFFWEDAVSMVVIALHTAYLASLIANWGSAEGLMVLALAAYASYAVNATQFILKLRAARRETLSTLRTGAAA